MKNPNLLAKKLSFGRYFGMKLTFSIILCKYFVKKHYLCTKLC